MSKVHAMFVSSDEQEMQAILQEANELRRARGLHQLGPWWQIERHSFFRTRRLGRAQRAERCPEDPIESTP